MEFTVKATFKATADQIYYAWLDSDEHSEMTGGEADISDNEGDEFTCWNGYISGVNVELQAGKIIKQLWRTTEFEEDEEDSVVEIQLKELNGETEVTLIHQNLPEDGEHYKKGWENHYFNPMTEYFSK